MARTFHNWITLVPSGSGRAGARSGEWERAGRARKDKTLSPPLFWLDIFFGTFVGRRSGAFAVIDFCPENASKASNHFPVFILLTPAFDI
ncbi:hypothetical protein MHYP_G00235970 [Metynnis hypsauchen]